MLLTLVIFYLLITIAIGLWAAKRVKNTADFAIDTAEPLPLLRKILYDSVLCLTRQLFYKFWKCEQNT